MKLLVQKNRNLVWIDAIYKNGAFYSSEEENRYYDVGIYAVKDDNRNKTVICSACGKEVPNTPSAIRAHRNMVNKSNKCFGCTSLRRQNEKTISQKYILNEDGTYSEATKRNVNLVCSMSYRYSDINSPEAKEHCRYARCENANFKHIEDFWTKYPNAFDEFITIDKIIDTGYKQITKYTDHIELELTGRIRIVAHINNQGVCHDFTLYCRRSSYTLRYSKKYDKVFVSYSSTFRDMDVLDIADSTKDAIIKKLRDLYN